jgi:23S rRNA pseudouridine1911/1915/1917 synthase
VSERPERRLEARTLEIVVPAALEAMRVDRVLSMLTGLSRAEARAMVVGGAVALDERTVTKVSTPVAPGQRLVALLPEADEGRVAPDPSVTLDVVLEDDDFVVLNKAPGQVVHPGAGHRDATLVAGLLARYPAMQRLSDEGLCDTSRPGVVHRLDKGTSGLLVVARSAQGLASLSRQLSERTMERTYLGLVEGHVEDDLGVVDAPIGRSTRSPVLMSVRGDGRPARTGYEVLERVTAPHATTLLRLKLETGRTHQIRVHLSAIGHPIVNDTRYGHRRDLRLDEERLFLHSASLAFTHPRSGERVAVTAALPEDLGRLLPGDSLA